MLISLRSAGVSDIGNHRSTNQDSAFTAPWGAAVADGVGGGPAGDLASAALTHRLVSGLRGPLTATQLLTRLREANWDLRAHVLRDRSLEGMATTFTGIFVTPNAQLVLAHTGDSRAYRLRAGSLTRQTRDDSFVQALVDRGLMSADEAASHPQRNVITASLHGGEDDIMSIVELDARPGDRWLLCSDGVSDFVPEPELTALMAGGSPSAAASAMVHLALELGSRDNVTAVVCDVAEGEASVDESWFYGAAATRFNERLETA